MHKLQKEFNITKEYDNSDVEACIDEVLELALYDRSLVSINDLALHAIDTFEIHMPPLRDVYFRYYAGEKGSYSFFFELISQHFLEEQQRLIIVKLG